MAYSFDPRLEHASTPPSSWYWDPAVLELERRAVFGRTWQLVGRMDQVSSPGDFFVTSIAGEPILVAHTREGEIAAMSNVCRHRAGPVAVGQGSCRSFRCQYHGWIYGLDGKLMATPEFDGVREFVRTNHPLPRFQCETWMGLIFVNLDPQARPFREEHSALLARISNHDFSSFRLALSKDWKIRCNWKVYVDNYLEGYHIPVVHPTLFEELDYANYRTETFDNFSIQHSPIRNAVRLRKDSEEDEAEYYWVYPNLMLNIYPDNFSTNLIVPVSENETITVFEWFFREGHPNLDATLSSTVAFSDEIQIEDITICEAVQANLRSSTYQQGRYSVARENGVHHFHGLLSRALEQEKSR